MHGESRANEVLGEMFASRDTHDGKQWLTELLDMPFALAFASLWQALFAESILGALGTTFAMLKRSYPQGSITQRISCL